MKTIIKKIKTITLCLVFILTGTAASGQSHSTTFRIDTFYTANLEAYEGVWEWTDETDTFRITLKKIPSRMTYAKGITISEDLVGDYYYSKDGVVLDSYNTDSLPKISNNETLKWVIINASNGTYKSGVSNPNLVTGWLNDKRKEYKEFYTGELKLKHVGLNLRLLEDGRLEFSLEEPEGPRVVHKDIPYTRGFSMPETMVLTKMSDTP